MNVDNLVTMANRIGDFFSGLSDEAEARASVAQHLAKFWEPRMREGLLAALDTPATARLSPLVRAAVVEHRDLLRRRGTPPRA